MGLFRKKITEDVTKQVIDPEKITIIIGKDRKKKKKVKGLARKKIRIKGKKK